MAALLLLSGICAALDWFAVGAGKRRLELLTKPATLFLLLAWTLSAIPRPGGALGAWLVAGLAFSLLGDVFLLVPERHFVHGLGAFLLAQVAYTIALNAQGLFLDGRSGAAAIAVGLLAIGLHARLRKGLAERGDQRMLAPVTVYLAAVSAMLWSAACATFRLEWPALAGGLVAAGGGLFFASDAVLAWNRFIQPFEGGRLLTRITYHLGQFGLAVGVVLVLLVR